MKYLAKVFSVFIIICVLFTGCDDFGTFHTNDILEYGSEDNYIALPDFFPGSIYNYDVNDYSYTVYSYMDVCYEIFLDVTVPKEEFDSLLERAKAYSENYYEQAAYYKEGYSEIVFIDEYSINDEKDKNVWNAKIEKVVFNPLTYNLVFISFDAFDSGVYPLDEVAYFNRFGIDQNEYIKHIAK
ncbi:MAG: hypothetical protein J6B93_02275 [Clostridia bacterium]|nr:hypothetical protein [Clostridia bacterium]